MGCFMGSEHNALNHINLHKKTHMYYILSPLKSRRDRNSRDAIVVHYKQVVGIYSLNLDFDSN